MHFPPSDFPGKQYFWETIRVFLSTMPLGTRLILMGYGVLLLGVLIFGKWKERLFYIGCTVMLILVALNPWMAWYLVSKQHFEDRYFRLFWLIPVVILYTHTAILLYQRVPKKGKAVMWVLLAVPVLFSFRQISVRSENLYHGDHANTALEPVDNIFKAEDDVVQVCDMINADSDPFIRRNVIYDAPFYLEARAYWGSLVAVWVPYFQYNGLDLDTAIENEDWRAALRAIYLEKPGACEKHPLDSETLQLVMENARCDYVVLRKTSSYYSLWVENFPVIGITGSYIVLKITDL